MSAAKRLLDDVETSPSPVSQRLAAKKLHPTLDEILEMENEASRIKIESLNEQLATATLRLELTTEKNTRLEARITSLERKLRHLEEQAAQLQQQINKLPKAAA